MPSRYFLSGGSWRNLLLLAAGGIGTAALFVWRHPYAWRRITGLFNPDLDPLGSGWHIRQFELAIARGGWFGSKLGGAVWSNAYLPFAYNDSAYATMAETLGWCGVLPVTSRKRRINEFGTNPARAASSGISSSLAG